MNNFKQIFALVVPAVLVATSAAAQSNDILSQSGFGWSVEVTESQIFVGEPLNNRFPGRVYVYDQDDASGAWERSAVLQAPQAAMMDGFGTSVSVEGDVLVVGASGDEADALYAFRRAAGGWTFEDALRPGADVSYDEIGQYVAIAGRRVFATVASEEGAVHVVVFSRSASGVWTEDAVVPLPMTASVDLARPVVSSSTVAYVGAPGVENGAVFSVEERDGNWNVSRILQDATVSGNSSFFGSALALSGELLIVGAPEEGEGKGAVHVYGPGEDGRLRLRQRLAAFGDSTMPAFGSVLAAHSGRIFVGAYDADEANGMTYVFSRSASGEFAPHIALAGEVMEEDAESSTAIAVHGGTVVIGAYADLFGYGSATVFEHNPDGGWDAAHVLRAELNYGQGSIHGGRVKCEDGNAGLFACEGVDIMSFVSNRDLGSAWGIQTNDVWGWTDPESGKEYAIVCTFGSTVFVDVSDPFNPVVVGTLQGTPGSRPNWWRDAKTYKNHVYIVADNVGEHGLQVFDMTQLRDVSNPPVEFEATAVYRGFDSAHNIIINEETGFAYVVGINGGGNTCGGGSHMLDLSEPTEPKFVGCFAHLGTGENQEGATHDAQCVIYRGPDERYSGREICVGANETALSIADFTDKSNVIPIAVGRYPNVSYAHQGWFTEDHRYFFQNDETDEINGLTAGTRTMVWDLAELDDPVLITEHVSENGATDHNLYVKGSMMYQSNYTSGLRLFDVSNPEQMEEVGYFDTLPWGDDRPGYGGSWSNYPFFKSGVIVVTSGEEGVFFLRRSEPSP